MLSFIVIGKNEGWKLRCCFESIFKVAEVSHLLKFEVIYVDSKSTDNSVEVAGEYDITVIRLSGDANAAIARNIGADNATGKILFFLDGDMELIPEQLAFFITENNRLLKPFMSGNWINYNYNRKWELQSTSEQFSIEGPEKSSTVGGLFLIEKWLWHEVGGMRAIFVRSQDIDLGLRLARKGYLLYRLDKVLVKHHTVPYSDKARMWDQLKDRTHLFARSLLYRKNSLNRFVYSRVLRHDYTLILLILCIILSFLQIPKLLLLFVYLAAIFLRGLKKGGASHVIYFILRDIKVLLGIFLFFPRDKHNIEFEITETRL